MEIKQWISYYEQFLTNKLSKLKFVLEEDTVDSSIKVVKTDKGSQDS